MSRAVGSVSSNEFAGKVNAEFTTQKLAGPTPASNRLTWKDKFSRFVYGTLGFHSMYHMFDIGLSNFLALDILKHGTNIKSYMSISLRGADPKMGGTNEAVFDPALGKLYPCQNQFYVMPNAGKLEDVPTSLVVPPTYIQMASLNLVGGHTVAGQKMPSLSSTVIGWMTPVLRFKFRPEDVTSPRFKPDHSLTPALFTEHSISPLRLGICGSLTQGIGRGMFWRMASHPLKVLSGAALMGGAAYIGKRTYTYVTSEPAKKEEALTSCDYSVQTIDGKSVSISPGSRRISRIAGLALLGMCALTTEKGAALLTTAALIGGAAYAGKVVGAQIANRLTKKERVLPSRTFGNAMDQKLVIHPRSRLNSRISAVVGGCLRLYGAYWLGVC
jgi:hypothetical protein